MEMMETMETTAAQRMVLTTPVRRLPLPAGIEAGLGQVWAGTTSNGATLTVHRYLGAPAEVEYGAELWVGSRCLLAVREASEVAARAELAALMALRIAEMEREQTCGGFGGAA